ncbi:hypothetical protein HN011_004244 [Eciton burchellii]|nr:hypothetical protein HN011_004244 [Eciton burchellii]
MRLYHFPAKITRTAASCCIRYRALDSGATEPIFGITISDRVSDHGNDNWETTIVPFIPRLTIFLPGIKVIATPAEIQVQTATRIVAVPLAGALHEFMLHFCESPSTKRNAKGTKPPMSPESARLFPHLPSPASPSL